MLDKAKGLEGEENFLQHVIDAVPDGVRVIGPDYRVLKVNAAYCRQLGISAEEALGKACYESSHQLDAPCSASLVTCPMEMLKTGKLREVSCVHRHLRKDNSELFVEVHAAVAKLGAEGQNYIVESIRDLSNQAEASHLQRLSEIGQLAAGIAHEIHNPLWSIQLALSSLRTELALDPSTKATESYIDIATAEIDRCLNVSRRLLHISEPAQQEPMLLDVGHTIHDVVSLVGYQAELAHVNKQVNIAGEPRIIAAESDFGIVILNLVQNAIHAMPTGGELVVSAGASGGKVLITVTDTGIGIAPENLNRIFWPFWSKRADNSSGSGLGLSICKATVQRMQGNIEVRSKQGSGTTFSVTLPDADWQGETA